jgi:hypothetical protein
LGRVPSKGLIKRFRDRVDLRPTTPPGARAVYCH